MEIKHVFQSQIPFYRVISLLFSSIADCKSDLKVDEMILAAWNANVCSCEHLCDSFSKVRAQWVSFYDDFYQVLRVIDTTSHGSMSVIVRGNQSDAVMDRSPIYGVLFECETENDRSIYVAQSLCENLRKLA